MWSQILNGEMIKTLIYFPFNQHVSHSVEGVSLPHQGWLSNLLVVASFADTGFLHDRHFPERHVATLLIVGC